MGKTEDNAAELRKIIFNDLKSSRYEEAVLASSISQNNCKIEFDLEYIIEGVEEDVIEVLYKLQDFDDGKISLEDLKKIQKAYITLGKRIIPLFGTLGYTIETNIVNVPDHFFTEQWHHWFDCIKIEVGEFIKAVKIINSLIKRMS